MTTATFLSSSPPIIDTIPVPASELPTPCNEYQTFMGFAYVPKPATHDSHQVHHDYTPSSSMLPLASNVSTDDFSNHRRRSKDSCESFGHGLNVDDIIDRLVSPELGHADEQMVPIFIIFFRKFMTPFELVQGLIKRFEDHMCMSVLPTSQQQRILSMLVSWMTDYWCDFYHWQARYQLNLFLGRLSVTMNLSDKTSTSTTLPTTHSLKHILDKLHNLLIQPVSDYDPDSTWGRKDDDDMLSKINLDKNKYTRASLSYSDASHLSHTNHTIDHEQHVQYTALSSSSIPYHPLSSASSSTLSYTSTTQQSSPVIPESLSPSTAATYSSPTLKHKDCPTISPSTLPLFGSDSTPSPVHHENRHTPINWKQSTNISTQLKDPTPKTISALPSHTTMNQPEFSGGTIGLDYLFSKSSTPSPLTSNVNPVKNRQYIHQRCEQTMQHSSSSSSSSLSITSLCSLTPGIFRMSTPPPPLSLSSRPMARKSDSTALLDRKCRNNNKTGLLHKCRLNTLISSRPNVSFSSSTCTDTSIPSSIHRRPPSFETNTKILLSLSMHEMADQLTWIEAELFGKIKSREFVRLIWANHDIKSVQQKQQQEQMNSMTSESSSEVVDQQSDKCDAMMAKSGLQASISHFNYISAWVISMVVTQPKLAKRVALLEKFMMIAVTLRNLNNYNTLMAVLAGINNAAILRLKQTQELIKKKKIYKRFQSLEKLMSSDRSYFSYRLALKASTTCPSIPYLGIHSQDLIALAEANKDVKTDGTVHWEKFQLMGESIMMIMKLQNSKHKVTPDQMILTWLADFSILTEEEQYQQSMQIEPRLKTTSTNHLRGFWSII
ncbi:ras guanine nucleotide exchange factor domain-containing protein [Absidia repens]|uniref:Ras guanine nucleotide exchange factor domain-containing protein n=1 Tax=Absidia repens TaxID=90262 RepID=A0A1X2ITM1_9FUNG|nr:ras guanine nucleotide exchange factor domain-containing protein [Absidia repens]